MRGSMPASEARKSPAESLRIEAISLAASALHRVLHATYRTRLLDRSYAERRAAGEDVRCIYACWHADLWHGIHALRNSDVHALVSSHRDGEIIARVMQRLGFRLARGSSTRGGARGMLDMARVAREATSDLAVAIDGPRGPARVIKEGVVYAASRTGLPILPFGVCVDRAWRVHSWDRHVIGKPLCRAVLAWGPELRVPADATRTELMETWMPALARAMDAAEARARAAAQGT
jgi:lysophospholipid acyltransferase (LPLAT)-like uncharacterized protein